ncbi:MAG: hypothetical protein ACO1N0_15880 [Fluviicola sp.]
MKRISIYIVVGIFVALGIGLSIVVTDYTNQFGNVYSKNTNDWSSFADYIGGIGNTLISLASLLLIGLLTILLGRDKNDYKYEQRNIAYDQLISHLANIKVAIAIKTELVSVLSTKIDWLSKEISRMEEAENSEKEAFYITSVTQMHQTSMEFLREFNENMVVLYEYQFFIENFYPRYGRLFKYKFSGDYKTLVSSAKKMIGEFMEYRDVLAQRSSKKLNEIPFEESTAIHIQSLTKFINELNKEL